MHGVREDTAMLPSKITQLVYRTFTVVVAVFVLFFIVVSYPLFVFTV